MHEVLNFAGGLVPNAAYTRARNSTAHDWNNLRVTDQGFLELRNGHTLLYHGIRVKDIFLYKGLMIGVLGTTLFWARVDGNTTNIAFDNFDPVQRVNTSGQYAFKVLQNENEEVILFSNGGSHWAIDLDGVFSATDPQDPTVSDFYLPTPDAPSVSVEQGDDADDTLERLTISIKVQSVFESDGVRQVISSSSSAVEASDINVLKPGKTLDDLRDEIDGNIFTRIFNITPDDVSPNDFQSIITVRLNLPDDGGGANKVDVYLTEPYDTDENEEPGDYYFATRKDYEDDLEFDLLLPPSYESLTGRNIIVEQLGLIDWDFIEIDNVRSYAANKDTNRLYFSYFDGINERLFRNFADFIPLPTGGEQITGVKFLGESNWIIVYTSQRIIIVAVDPNPELIEVVGIYGSLENDEYIGCIAPKSLVGIGRYHFFLGGDRRVYRFGGRQPTWLSSKVQPILKSVEVPIPFEPVGAYATADDGNYILSFPSTVEHHPHTIQWREEPVEWHSDTVRWAEEETLPNTTLILDTERNLWYRDGFGVKAFQKGATGRLYGIITGAIYSLYDGDNSDLDWLWQSNRILMNERQLVHNVSVKTQEPASLGVRVETEEGVQEQELDITEANDYWGQRAGINLRGRTLDVTIEGQGPVEIDRLAVNERPRRANLR